jgi:hypothetical protein
MNLLCIFGLHSKKTKRENYTISPEHGSVFKAKLDVSTCSRCGKRKAYTIVREYSPRDKKYWKDWTYEEGSQITWKDLAT